VGINVIFNGCIFWERKVSGNWLLFIADLKNEKCLAYRDAVVQSDSFNSLHTTRIMKMFFNLSVVT
jgi:hypothetical protein